MKSKEGGKLKAAVFLDRDGTINVDTGYIAGPEELRLIEGSARGLKALNDNGVKVVVITNQSGVARGFFTLKDVDAVNRRLAELLEKKGARFDALYYCPHHPDDSCECRKPGKGLVKRAAKEHGIDPAISYVVGDRASDVELAAKIGAKGVLVKTGPWQEELRKLSFAPALVAQDLLQAVRWILDDLKKRAQRSALK
ncbi:MAG: D-glycero-beta-D-manno-heptose 1,7-bisphosphate 7-phosphatase [Thermodesulfobacteriota bacterium]